MWLLHLFIYLPSRSNPFVLTHLVAPETFFFFFSRVDCDSACSLVYDVG